MGRKRMSRKTLLLFLATFLLIGCSSEFQWNVRKNNTVLLERVEQTGHCIGTSSVLGINLSTNSTVTSLSAAGEKNGLKRCDKIVSVNGKKVESGQDVTNIIKPLTVGSPVDLTVNRHGKEIPLKARTYDCRRAWDQTLKLLMETSKGKWQDCLGTVNMIIEQRNYSFPESTYFMTKYDCTICRDIDYRDPQTFNLQAALSLHEGSRSRILENSCSKEGIAAIKSTILANITTLRRNGYQEYAEDLQSLLDDNLPSTSTPDRRDRIPAGSIVTGTGFSVSPTGLVVTAYHVVKDAQKIRVRLPDGQNVFAELKTSNPSNDLALLKVPIKTPDYLSLAPLRTIQIGQRVFTIGYPLQSVLGQEPKYSDGSIASLSGLGGTAFFLQISVPVQPGSSGGPLVNDRGQVGGVITSSAAILPLLEATGTLPQDINWAVKSDYLLLLIDIPAARRTAKNRREAIQMTEAAICLVEAEYSVQP